MSAFSYQGKHFTARDGETFLECLLRHGVDINHSCKRGICHACKSKATEVSEKLYAGSLSPELVAKGYFLPCKTVAHGGACFDEPDVADLAARPPAGLADEAWAQPELAYPETDPELWQALDQGTLLKAVLDEFYDRVYEDPVLSPYFQHFTKQRSKEKVFSFYRQLFTGERVFFGDRPKNAHAWMVITDEVFDYRLSLLAACMRRQGLADGIVQRWLRFEEYYRSDIVKARPQGRKVGVFSQPAGGFDREVLDSGTLCDACEGEVQAGEEVLYNLRTGQVYCAGCHGHQQE
ncbi:hypothetical protein C7H09_16915 [Marinobacter fuscus]|uniref:2Fe-2S ferredoxin-type domain-containing protein n=1 Tax=Marinobacter fuscus TaxID=2109942 RepID=A0A2T1K4E7_9GAMM|nr:2Fe-2S iron-sulfur cluster-binding protein [Marinobacter fuscus]PSF05029.1 hypothetical protein C7H09_16915 [Marinobacter fuscus]